MLYAKYKTKILITGDSLGGAIATYGALDIKSKFAESHPDEEVDILWYTMESPRVGNKEFARYFNKQFPDANRITH